MICKICRELSKRGYLDIVRICKLCLPLPLIASYFRRDVQLYNRVVESAIVGMNQDTGKQILTLRHFEYTHGSSVPICIRSVISAPFLCLQDALLNTEYNWMVCMNFSAHMEYELAERAKQQQNQTRT